jgi:hypothetical protein
LNKPPKELSNWVGGGVIAAMGVSVVATIVHVSGHAPLGLVSLVVGVGLGSILVALAKRLHVTANKFEIWLAIAVACLAVVLQHGGIYSDFRRQWRDSLQRPQVAIFRSQTPPSPIEYFSREATPGHIALWIFDAAIIIVSAATIFWRFCRPQHSAIHDSQSEIPQPPASSP